MIELERGSDSAAHWNRREYEMLFTAGAPLRISLVAVPESSEGEVAGFVVARSLGFEWEIENVVVAGERRRSGIGSALMQALLQNLRSAGVPGVLLEVRESNTAARRLYEKLGFALEGRRRGYYQDPVEDALLFRLM